MFLLVVRRIFWETGCSTKSWAFPSAQIPFSKCTDTIFQVHRYHLKLSWAFPSTQIPCWPELNLLGITTVTEGTYCWCWAVSECVDLYKATSTVCLLLHWLMKCLFLCWNVGQFSIASMASTDAACLWSVRNPCNTPHNDHLHRLT